MRTGLFLLLFYNLFCVFLNEAFSQVSRPPVFNYTPKEYGKNESPKNICVFQDKAGYIYAGSSGGIKIFDGKNWNHVEIQYGAYVTAINQTNDGTIYVSTNAGEFGKIISQKNGIVLYKSLKSLFDKKNYHLAWVTQLNIVENSVYITNAEGNLFIFSNNKISKVATQTSFHLAFACNGKIYARERKVGLVEITGGSKNIISSLPEFSEYGVFGVLPGENHLLFIVTREKGIWKYENKTITCINTDSIALKNYNIYGCIALKDGNYAANTENSGVLIFDKNGKIIDQFDKKIGLKSNEAQKVIQDKDENLWIATSNGISQIIYSSPLSFFSSESGLTGNIQSIVVLEGEIYVGTNEGLFILNPNERIFESVPNINCNVWEIISIEGMIYIASDKGVFKGKGKSFSNLSFFKINTLTYVPQYNALAVAGIDQVALIDKNNGQIINEAYFDESLSRAIGIVLDPNSTSKKVKLWLGTLSKGIHEINFSDTKNNIVVHNNLNELSLIATRPVIINKEVYICTTGGLRKLKIESGKSFFDFAGFHPDLDNANISDLKQSGNRIWVCANNEVFYLGDKNHPVKTPFLPVDLGQIFSLYAVNDNTCWIAGADGVAKFSENKQAEFNRTFDIAVHSIYCKGDSLLFKGIFNQNNTFTLGQPQDYNIELPYNLNSIELSVSALYYNLNDKIIYSHKLVGGDNTWSKWSNESIIKYTNLKEGDYTLEIKARNIYNTESKITRIKFKVFPPWYRTKFAYIIYVILLLLVIYLTNKISSARLKKKNEQLEKIVVQRTKEIANKNQELNQQNIQIIHQKQEITDSINYAKKIQEAMLPFDSEMKKVLPESFVLFKPKDIVSGDFYWIGKIDEFLIIICADCTGHGVPGAFMSMLCIDKLNQIIAEKKITLPNLILEYANKGIKKSLGQADEQNLKMKDGMDAAVLVMDTKNNKLLYAGANRPLWRIRNGVIEEFKPDKCAVGGFTPENKSYTLQTIDLENNDCFYTSTDGYADQFGGLKGKKIMVKNFKEFLQNIQNESFATQLTRLDNFLEDWKNVKETNAVYEQVDDVCVIGFKISLQ